MKAINTYAASVVCYAAGVVKWTKKTAGMFQQNDIKAAHPI